MAKRRTESPPIELWGIGKYGIVRDQKPHLLPPEALTDGFNIRFGDNGPERMPGYSDAFGAMLYDPHFILNVPTVADNYWIYLDLEKAAVYDGINHTDITRLSGDYTTTNGYDWQATILAGIPIFNNFADIPQYWTGIGSAFPLADLTDWPATLRAKIIKAVGPYLVAFNLIDNGNARPKTMRWSSFADPGTLPASWDINDATIDAGELQLTDDKGGQILDAGLLGNLGIVYTEGSTHAIRYVGGVDIFGSELLLKESGILATKCHCAFKKGAAHFVVTQDDIIVHQGTKQADSIVDKIQKKRIFGELDPEYYRSAFCFEDSANQEVVFCYPTIGNQTPNQAMVWNYRDNTISFRSAPFACADTGSVYAQGGLTWDDLNDTWNTSQGPWASSSRNNIVVGNLSDGLAHTLGSSNAYGGQPATSYIERVGLAIDGKDREGKPKSSIQTRKLCKRLWPKITGTEPVSIQVGSQQMVDGPVTWQSPQTFNPQTEKYLDVTAEGLLLAYRIEHTGLNPWYCEGMDFQIEVLASGI